MISDGYLATGERVLVLQPPEANHPLCVSRVMFSLKSLILTVTSRVAVVAFVDMF